MRRMVLAILAAGVSLASLFAAPSSRAQSDDGFFPPLGCPGIDRNVPAGTYVITWDGIGHAKCTPFPFTVSPSGMVGIAGAPPVSQLTIRSPYRAGATSVQLSTQGQYNANQTTINLETYGNGASFLGDGDSTQGWSIAAHGLDKSWGDTASQLGMSYWNGGVWTDTLTLTPNGFVGIDTTTPNAALDVNGSILIDGALQPLTRESADTVNALRNLKPCGSVADMGNPPGSQPASGDPSGPIQVLTKTGDSGFACVDLPGAAATRPPVCNGPRQFLQFDGKSFTCAQMW